MSDPILVVPYDPQWQEEFLQIGTRIREALDTIAVRIDHIGSTSIAGLAAKPIVDIQISVRSLEPMVYQPLLENVGYYYRADNPDLTKRYFREGKGRKRTHIHVREAGSWSEQFALLFRDYLRQHPEDSREYAKVKYELMERFGDQRHRYVEEKGPVIWKIMTKASSWSQEAGWRPGEPDI
ncbi:GrpB family protein [Paenibacillus sp. J2TS4]|uniref:GrpB family protein n=1 Tax=Paenibacillus sp. J2TS4 TaxID=2807194 RepID=UPI001B0F0031|nr:GrpB family protein [Paenibacillus sp. J2TS4]GIP34634.1 hypothetical protein J2TS4_38440 [Paenibacillus sp. J2TS4]